MNHGIYDDRGAVQRAAGGLDEVVYLWDAETLQELAAGGGHSDWVLGMAISADGERLATVSGDATARVWALSTGEELCIPDEFIYEV